MDFTPFFSPNKDLEAAEAEGFSPLFSIPSYRRRSPQGKDRSEK